MHTNEEKAQALTRVIETLDILRVQCPWDRKQTNESLRPNTIEEVFELADALRKEDLTNIKKELGDVLLHVLFYAKIASEKGEFDIADVAGALNDKLIFRHPHVFGNTNADTAEQVSQNWEQIKLKERDGNRTVLSGIPDAMPSLIKAYRMQEKAANVGFDWPDKAMIWDKLAEEIAEFKAAASDKNTAEMESEMGDILFTVVNLARSYGIHPDTALDLTNDKFRHRFDYIEHQSQLEGKSINDLNLEQMDKLWDEAKH